jgi:hypothetical protein
MPGRWTYELRGCEESASMQMTQVTQILTVYFACKNVVAIIL